MEKIEILREKAERLDIWGVIREARKMGLNGVLNLFWENHPGVDLALWLGPDNLYALHRFFRNHILRWAQHLMGEKEYDRRLMALQPEIRFGHFAEGFSHLQQLTGREDPEIQRTFVALCAGAEGINNQALEVFRAMMDFVMLAQYESHTPATLKYLTDSLATFHQLKSVFVKTSARQGTKGVKCHFNIPKLYGLHTYALSIPQMGSSPQHSTEFGEHAHIEFAKDPYNRTNHRVTRRKCVGF